MKIRQGFPLEMIAFATVLVLWWSLLNFTAELKWRGYDLAVLPLLNTSKEVVEVIKVMMMIWGLAVREYALPTQRRLAFA